jgi:hypothetical protein
MAEICVVDGKALVGQGGSVNPQRSRHCACGRSFHPLQHPPQLMYKFKMPNPRPHRLLRNSKACKVFRIPISTAANALKVTSATSVASNARAAPWTQAAARTVLNLTSHARTLGRQKEAQALCIPRRLLLRSSRRLQTLYRPVIQPDARLCQTLMSQGLIVQDAILAKSPAPQPREAGLSPFPQLGRPLREPLSLSSRSCSLHIMKRSTQCEPFALSNGRK